MPDEDTVETGLAPQDDTQISTEDTSDNGSSEESGEQETETLSERTYADKYKTPEELEKAYKELETKLGGYKTLEEKARAFDELSRVNLQPSVPAKTAQDFVAQDGSVDWAGYNQYVQQQSEQSARKAIREELDLERSEKEFPYMKEDKDAADAVISLYRTGGARTLYEAAQRIDRLRQGSSEVARKEGAQEKEREIASKVRGQTERAGAKSSTENGVTAESFSKLSLADKRKVIEGFGN